MQSRSLSLPVFLAVAGLPLTLGTFLLSSSTAFAQTIDHTGGFATHSDLTANGTTTFPGGVARLTTSVPTIQGGTFFNTAAVDITQFTNTFTFALTNLNGAGGGADGITFIIQNNAPTANGGSGGGLGYTGIANSIAIKYDIFQNLGDPSDSSTGLSQNGAAPFGGTSLYPSGINLRSGDTFRSDMNYDGSLLSVTITDLNTSISASQSYSVNLPTIVGGSTAFVGFGGGTGAGAANQDITTWKFVSTRLPEPGSLSLLAAAGMARFVRRKRRVA